MRAFSSCSAVGAAPPFSAIAARMTSISVGESLDAEPISSPTLFAPRGAVSPCPFAPATFPPAAPLAYESKDAASPALPVSPNAVAALPAAVVAALKAAAPAPAAAAPALPAGIPDAPMSSDVGEPPPVPPMSGGGVPPPKLSTPGVGVSPPLFPALPSIFFP